MSRPPPPLPMLRAAVLGTALLLGSPLLSVPAHAQAPRPSLVVDGTVLEAQPGVPLCGVLATAAWVRIRIDAVHTPIGGHLPAELYVMVPCNRLRPGQQRRFRLVGRRPTRGSWRGFLAFPPDPPAPPWWALRVSRVPPGP